jgi:C4-dicarboxylate-specific signal transduction histidine kinase
MPTWTLRSSSAGSKGLATKSSTPPVKVVDILAVLHDKPMKSLSFLEPVMTIFATRTIAEIERKQPQEELDKQHQQLESLVKKRTKELTKANEQLRQEIAERKHGEKEIKCLNKVLTAFVERKCKEG